MEKAIITIYGRQNEGKTETVKRICKKLLGQHPYAKVYEYPKNIIVHPSKINYKAHDIELVVDLGAYKIGIASQGDPKTWQHERIDNMAKADCDIIVCTARTRGETQQAIGKASQAHDYHVIWMSSYWCPGLDHDMLNDEQAQSVMKIIQGILGRELGKRN